MIRGFTSKVRGIIVYAVDKNGDLVDYNPRTLLRPALSGMDPTQPPIRVVHGNTGVQLNLSQMPVFSDMIYRRSQYKHLWQRAINIVSTTGTLYFTFYTNGGWYPPVYGIIRDSDSMSRIRDEIFRSWGLDTNPPDEDIYVYITYVLNGCVEDITRAPGVNEMLCHLLHDEDAMVLESNAVGVR